MMRGVLSEQRPLKKGTWSPDEDEKLIAHIKRFGIWNWNQMPEAAGLARSGKSCRLRWMNYLRPDIKHGSFSKEEEEIIFKLHEILGNRWSAIAAKLPGRTDNDIKNYWNTNLRKRLKKKNGIASGSTVSKAPLLDAESSKEVPNSSNSEQSYSVEGLNLNMIEVNNGKEQSTLLDYNSPLWSNNIQFCGESFPLPEEEVNNYKTTWDHSNTYTNQDDLFEYPDDPYLCYDDDYFQVIQLQSLWDQPYVCPLLEDVIGLHN